MSTDADGGLNAGNPGSATSEADAGQDLPLAGIRVLDLGHVFAGPYAAFLLAMAGADVIKIESPNGDMSRRRGRDGDYPFRALNGCKRGVVLNLKTERGRELLLQLAEQADVLVENFAPSVMTRLGLGPDVFLARNSRLVYASGTGFGRSGPQAGGRALDLTIQAMSGVMSATGERGGPPLKAGVPVADFMAGAHLYGGILSALVGRARTGRGRVVEVSMLEALFATLLPSAGHAYQTNSAPERSGNRHVADSYVPFDAFRASDGWVTVVCATDEHWLKLTDAMQRPDLRADQELRQLAGRIARIDEVTDAVAQWTARRTRAEITEACQQAQVAAAPLRDVMEVLADPHLHARGFFTSVPGPDGPVLLPNSPVRYDASSLRALTPAPELGEHTDQVLAELCGLDETALKELRQDGVINP
jgi:CoA:oxalate CoA-transferase